MNLQGGGVYKEEGEGKEGEEEEEEEEEKEEEEDFIQNRTRAGCDS